MVDMLNIIIDGLRLSAHNPPLRVTKYKYCQMAVVIDNCHYTKQESGYMMTIVKKPWLQIGLDEDGGRNVRV
jgi:hypothetical protein